MDNLGNDRDTHSENKYGDESANKRTGERRFKLDGDAVRPETELPSSNQQNSQQITFEQSREALQSSENDMVGARQVQSRTDASPRNESLAASHIEESGRQPASIDQTLDAPRSEIKEDLMNKSNEFSNENLEQDPVKEQSAPRPPDEICRWPKRKKKRGIPY